MNTAPCHSMSVAEAITLLEQEKTTVNAELGKLPAAEWLSAHGRALGNRESELWTTTDVLRRLVGQERFPAAPAPVSNPNLKS